MFHFHVITIFPEIFDSYLRTSLVGKAVESELIRVSLIDPRTFTEDRHHTVDDTPFGGGHGMVMKPDPLAAALESVPGRPHRLMFTPQGEHLRQHHLDRLAGEEAVVLVCGRYEGFDERVRSLVDQEVSLGDFVLGGGEAPAMVLIEGVARLLPGVIGNPGSLRSESHAAGLLEYPQYTRPRQFRGLEVPEVLLSGDHERIRRWRRLQMLERTRERRPDLWARFQPTDEDRELLGETSPGRRKKKARAAAPAEPPVPPEDPALAQQRRTLGELAARTTIALLHHPVLDRSGRVVTTAVTNLDLHDIARSSRSYGLCGYRVVTPLTSQRELVRRILDHWRGGHGSRVNPRRGQALDLLEVCASLEQVKAELQAQYGEEPLLVATSAVARPGQVSRQEVLEALGPTRPLLLLLGTGWGLTEEGLAQAQLQLRPIRGAPQYNHLSVRSAAAILLDRFFGLRQ